MTQENFNNIWNYYLSLEEDFQSTSRYIEPAGQENVHSFEFAKLLVLACTEVESVMKQLCLNLEKKACGNIGEYKQIILKHYKKIVTAEVTVSRWNRTIKPFDGWGEDRLQWWDAYGKVKHSREANFVDATYKNAVFALGALYILIFYLAANEKLQFKDYVSKYIDSEYSHGHLIIQGNRLPDFVEG